MIVLFSASGFAAALPTVENHYGESHDFAIVSQSPNISFPEEIKAGQPVYFESGAIQHLIEPRVSVPPNVSPSQENFTTIIKKTNPYEIKTASLLPSQSTYLIVGLLVLVLLCIEIASGNVPVNKVLQSVLLLLIISSIFSSSAFANTNIRYFNNGTQYGPSFGNLSATEVQSGLGKDSIMGISPAKAAISLFNFKYYVVGSTTNVSAGTVPLYNGTGFATPNNITGKIQQGDWVVTVSTNRTGGTGGVAFIGVGLFSNCSDTITRIGWSENRTSNVMTVINPLDNINFTSVGFLGVAAQDFSPFGLGCNLIAEAWLNKTAISTGAGPTIKFVFNNSQQNITYPKVAGVLNITLLDPTVTQTSVVQNATFIVNVSIKCLGSSEAECGTVNGTIFYNLTSSAGIPTTELNGTVGQKPFYNFTSLVNFSCGTMTGGQACNANWTVNATGYIGSNWTLIVRANSSDGNVTSNYTANFSVNITDVVAAAAASMQFSILTRGAASTNISSPAFPGNTTLDIWFNATRLDSKYVEPCMAGGSNCQSYSGLSPIMIFKNTGTLPFNLTMVMNNTPDSGITLFLNATNGTDVTGCSGYSVASNSTIISTSPIVRFAKAMCAGNETDIYLFANFSVAAPGIYNSTLNYTSNST